MTRTRNRHWIIQHAKGLEKGEGPYTFPEYRDLLAQAWPYTEEPPSPPPLGQGLPPEEQHASWQPYASMPRPGTDWVRYADPSTAEVRMLADEATVNRYASRQAWNADMSLLFTERDVKLISDGRTFEPLAGAPFNITWSYLRPSLAIAVGNVIDFYDVSRSGFAADGRMVLPDDHSDGTVGGGHGDPSLNDLVPILYDGRSKVSILDMQTRGWVAHFDVGSGVDNCLISHDGRWLVTVRKNPDQHQVWDIQSPGDGPRSIWPKSSHSDTQVDANGDQCIVGSESSGGGNRILSVRLADGAITEHSTAANRYHVSGRMYLLPGWAGFSTYSNDTGPQSKGYGENYLIKLDGTGTVRRFGPTHNRNESYPYTPKTTWSPDGTLALFSSSWDPAGPLRAFIQRAA